MALKRPLCLYTGRIEELRPEDSLPLAAGARLAADMTTSATTPQASALKIALAGNTRYRIAALLLAKSSFASNGIGLTANGPASPVLHVARFLIPTSATAMSVISQVDYLNNSVSPSVPVANSPIICTLDAWLQTGAVGGDYGIYLRSELSSRSVTLLAGSTLEATPL